MDTLLQSIYIFFKNRKDETVIFFGVVFLIFTFALYVFASGLMTVFVDQGSHLNIARQIFDSLTPGISQVGFWPPLLHILMSPFAQVDNLYYTGLAGALTLIPVVAFASVYLFKLIDEITENRTLAYLGVLFFVFNPYVLYYSVVPMTEMLFVSLLIVTAYFLYSWLMSGSFMTLVALGLFVAATSLSRFEGFLVVAVVGCIVVAKLLLDRKNYFEIEGTVILFGVLGGIGIAFTFIYGIVYAGDPLVFINGPWSAPTQQQYVFVPTDGSIAFSLLYMIESAKLLLGKIVVTLSFGAGIGALILLIHDKRYFAYFSILLVLLSPFLFDFLALYQGSAVVYLNYLPPFKGFFNERYGLYLIGFVIISIITFVAELSRRSTFIYPNVRSSLGLFVLVAAIAGSFQFLSETLLGPSPLSVIHESGSTIRHDQIDLAQVLASEYDGGKIFLTRAVQNFVTLRAEIPLKNYIMESNFKYYDLTLERPWLYARWIVTYNPNALTNDQWRSENEKIAAQWIGNPLFDDLYEMVYENDTGRLYRLRDEKVRILFAEFNIDTSFIPSLNPTFVTWEPAMTEKYLEEHLADASVVYDTSSEILATLKEVVPPAKNI
jgi:hypothetical protein